MPGSGRITRSKSTQNRPLIHNRLEVGTACPSPGGHLYKSYEFILWCRNQPSGEPQISPLAKTMRESACCHPRPTPSSHENLVILRPDPGIGALWN